MSLRNSSAARNGLLSATIFVLTCTGASLQAQQAADEPAQHTTTLVVNTRLVVLDVVALDKGGKPVTDLTRDDFSVYEDGKLQRLSSFESPASHVLPASELASADPTATFDPAQPKAFGQSPVTELVLDQLNTHFADSSFARRSLRDYLTAQPALLAQPTVLLTVYDNRFKVVHQYTRDRDALLKALEAEPTHNAWKLETLGISDYGPLERLDQTLRALEQIAQSGARIPGRKNVIWVGGGFPSIDPYSVDGKDAAEIKNDIQHITNTLQDTHVTLYAVDPTSTAAGMTEITDQTQAEFIAVVADASTGKVQDFDMGQDFDRLAPLTGGRVIRGMNDITHQIALSVDLGRSYYTLGYSPTSAANTSARFRHIRVDCKRAGLTLIARDGYFPEENRAKTSAAPESISYDLSTAAESAVPLNGLRIEVQPSTSVSVPPTTYTVRVNADGLTWKANDDGTSSASVAVLAVYLDRKGKLLQHTLHGMTANAREGANLRDPAKTADFAFTVDATAGKASTLRFVVRDSANGRMGTFDVSVK